MINDCGIRTSNLKGRAAFFKPSTYQKRLVTCQIVVTGSQSIAGLINRNCPALRTVVVELSNDDFQKIHLQNMGIFATFFISILDFPFPPLRFAVWH